MNRRRPVSASQSRTVPSRPAEATSRPSRVIATPRTAPLRPGSVGGCSPLSRSAGWPWPRSTWSAISIFAVPDTNRAVLAAGDDAMSVPAEGGRVDHAVVSPQDDALGRLAPRSDKFQDAYLGHAAAEDDIAAVPAERRPIRGGLHGEFLTPGGRVEEPKLLAVTRRHQRPIVAGRHMESPRARGHESDVSRLVSISQFRTVPSSPPAEKRLRPSPLRAKPRTWSRCPRNSRASPDPVASQTRIRPSSPAEATRRPSSLHATRSTGPSWPPSDSRKRPLRASQTRTFPSRPAEATLQPSTGTRHRNVERPPLLHVQHRDKPPVAGIANADLKVVDADPGDMSAVVAQAHATEFPGSEL